jgi:hypothetical protein
LKSGKAEKEMINFNNIKSYSTDFPKTWSFLWSQEEADEISQEDKDRIFFLDNEAGEFVRNYMNSSKMVTGPPWKPFNERYFKTVQEFEVTENCEKEIKKWLYNKPVRKSPLRSGLHHICIFLTCPHVPR